MTMMKWIYGEWIMSKHQIIVTREQHINERELKTFQFNEIQN